MYMLSRMAEEEANAAVELIDRYIQRPEERMLEYSDPTAQVRTTNVGTQYSVGGAE